MVDRMVEGRRNCVLLVDLRRSFRDALLPELQRRGLRPIELASDGAFDCRISSDLTTGWIAIGQLAEKHQIANFAASIAEPSTGAATAMDQNPAAADFYASELMASVGFVRFACGRALNAPTSGAIFTFCGSLPEQWEEFRRLGFRTPSWRWGDAASDATSSLQISDIFDYRLRVASDKGAQSQGRLYVDFAEGAYATCAFAGEAQHHLLFTANGPRTIEVPQNVLRDFDRVIDAVRDLFSLDFGELSYRFDGSPAIWSVSPAFAPEHFDFPEFMSVTAALVEDALG